MKANFVYWIHRESHTDPHSQGYVGVSNNPGRRYLGYLSYASGKGTGDSSNNKHLISALRKYEDVVCDLMYMGDREECLLLEEMYRPEDGIGWNLVKGGGDPPQGEHQNLYKNVVAKYGDEYPEMNKEWGRRGYAAQPEEARQRARVNGGIAVCAMKTFEERSTYTKGKFWWNDGIRCVRAFTCPEGFTAGRIKKI